MFIIGLLYELFVIDSSLEPIKNSLQIAKYVIFFVDQIVQILRIANYIFFFKRAGIDEIIENRRFAFQLERVNKFDVMDK